MFPWLLRATWGGFTCVFNMKAEAAGCELKCVTTSHAEHVAELSPRPRSFLPGWCGFPTPRPDPATPWSPISLWALKRSTFQAERDRKLQLGPLGRLKAHLRGWKRKKATLIHEEIWYKSKPSLRVWFGGRALAHPTDVPGWIQRHPVFYWKKTVKAFKGKFEGV